ncbi:MAG: hypothetical protein JXB39_00515 [Deltaproteobacteria bacterium]|nr:hypothetical protein [Deltaproteobacteria bacterium]
MSDFLFGVAAVSAVLACMGWMMETKRGTRSALALAILAVCAGVGGSALRNAAVDEAEALQAQDAAAREAAKVQESAARMKRLLVEADLAAGWPSEADRQRAVTDYQDALVEAERVLGRK